MASVFKRTRKCPIPRAAQIVRRAKGPVAVWTDNRGTKRTEPLSDDGLHILIEAADYTIQYTDARGVVKRKASGCSDYDGAMRLARELETREAHRKEGVIDDRVERMNKAARAAIADHAAAYIAHLRSSGRTTKHVTTVERHLRVIFSAARIESLSGLTTQAVQDAISAMRTPQQFEGKNKQKPPASLATCNGHLRSVKGFSRWLWKQRLAPEDALLDLGLFNSETDRRHIRREMSAEEVQWLLDVTEQRTIREHGAPGPTRAMCYRLAAATGFRANELRSLTTDSFDLDATPPTCTVEAGYSKRRKRDVQPLPDALVEPLRAWLAGFDPGERVFAGIARDTARMLRSDLVAARAAWLKAAEQEPDPVRQQMQESDFLLYSDRQGHVADFHSLRVLFISRVVASGASVKEAQTLARHSTPLLTMNTYSRATLRDLAGAVAGLGNMLARQPNRQNPTPCQPGPVVHAVVHDRAAGDGSGRPEVAQ